MEGPFKERYKDMVVKEIIAFDDGTAQVNGYNLQGEKVWILLTILEPIQFSVHSPDRSPVS